MKRTNIVELLLFQRFRGHKMCLKTTLCCSLVYIFLPHQSTKHKRDFMITHEYHVDIRISFLWFDTLWLDGRPPVANLIDSQVPTSDSAFHIYLFINLSFSSLLCSIYPLLGYSVHLLYFCFFFSFIYFIEGCTIFYLFLRPTFKIKAWLHLIYVSNTCWWLCWLD